MRAEGAEELGNTLATRHTEVRPLLAAYALGAVDSDETDAIAIHLDACDDCRRELADLVAATQALTVARNGSAVETLSRLVARVRGDSSA